MLGIHRRQKSLEGTRMALWEHMGGASFQDFRLEPWQPIVLAGEPSVTSYMYWIYFYLRKVQVHH